MTKINCNCKDLYRQLDKRQTTQKKKNLCHKKMQMSNSGYFLYWSVLNAAPFWEDLFALGSIRTGLGEGVGASYTGMSSSTAARYAPCNHRHFPYKLMYVKNYNQHNYLPTSCILPQLC